MQVDPIHQFEIKDFFPVFHFGGYQFVATLPFIMVVLLYALELLVAFLQAYVFAILTCIYLNDAFHPGH